MDYWRVRPALPELAGFYVDSVLRTSFRCYYERRGCGCVSSDRVSVGCFRDWGKHGAAL